MTFVMRVFFRFCFLLVGLLVPALRGAAQSARFTGVATAYNHRSDPSRYIGSFDGTTDATGNTYLWVHYTSDFTIGGVFHQAPPDSVNRAALVKLSPSGALVWLREIGEQNGYLTCNSVKTDAAGNVYGLGEFHSSVANATIDGAPVSGHQPNINQMWVAKWSSSGAIQFARSVGYAIDSDVDPWRLDVSATGELAVIGQFWREMVIGTDTLRQRDRRNNRYVRTGSFVARFSNAGAVQWVKQFHSVDTLAFAFVADMGSDSAGNTYVNGIYGGPSGAITGIGNVTFPTNHNTFWVRLSPTGQVINTQTDTYITGGIAPMVVLPDGTSYASYPLTRPVRMASGDWLRPAGAGSVFVFRYDPDGTTRWVHQIGGGDSLDLTTTSDRLLARAADGGVLVGGTTRGVITDGNVRLGLPAASRDTPSHAWAIALTADGKALWGQKMTSVEGELARQIHALPDGQAVLVAQTQAEFVGLGGLGVSAPGNLNYKIISARISQQYNTLTGAAYLDANADGVQNPSEGGFPGSLVVEVNPGAVPCAVPETTGRYDAYVDLGVNFTASLPSPPPYYTVVTQGAPPATFSTYGNTAAGRSFALQPIANQRDVEVILTLISPARPGNLLNYQVQYRNVGTVAITGGTVVLTPDARLVWQSSSSPGIPGAGGAQTWVYAGLQPGETRRLNVVYRLPATAVLGTVVSSTATLTPLTGDLDAANNTSVAERVVTGSFDPNDIEVNHLTLSTTQVAAGEWLEYTIRFQNHGTDTAFTVRLTDSLPAARLRLATLRVMAASHYCNWGLSPQGELTVQFPNILLPAQLTNQIASDGFVRFRVRPVTALVPGDVIPNQAEIHFDYNAPMATNTVLTAVAAPTGLGAVTAATAGQAQVWPNPTSGALHVEVPRETTGTLTLTLLDALGRAARTEAVAVAAPGRTRAQLDVRGLPAGLYLLRGEGAGEGFARRVVVK